MLEFIGLIVIWWSCMALIIRRSVLDKTSGYPPIALLAAFSWNIVYAICYYDSLPSLDRIAVFGYCFLDFLLLFVVLRYSPREYTRLIHANLFPYVFLSLLAFMIGYQYFFFLFLSDLSGDPHSHYLSIWLTTQAMYLFFYSLAFIAMLLHRKNTLGQSIYFPILRIAGNTLFLITLYDLPIPYFVYYLGVSMTFFDLIYLKLLYHYFEKENINPWGHI